MPTPVELKCYQCMYFTEVKIVPEEEGMFKYLCLAYPEGIPEDIRCWDVENPSAKPRPHTSIQDDQVGDFVFEKRLPERDIDLTADNILGYQMYDKYGLVGNFATTVDLELFRKYVFKLGEYYALKEFIDKGTSLITQELIDDIFLIKSEDKNLQKTITILQKLIDEADTLVIISTGD